MEEDFQAMEELGWIRVLVDLSLLFILNANFIYNYYATFFSLAGGRLVSAFDPESKPSSNGICILKAIGVLFGCGFLFAIALSFCFCCSFRYSACFFWIS